MEDLNKAIVALALATLDPLDPDNNRLQTVSLDHEVRHSAPQAGEAKVEHIVDVGALNGIHFRCAAPTHRDAALGVLAALHSHAKRQIRPLSEALSEHAACCAEADARMRDLGIAGGNKARVTGGGNIFVDVARGAKGFTDFNFDEDQAPAAPTAAATH